MSNTKSLYDVDLLGQDANSADSNFKNSYDVSTRIILELLFRPCSERMICYNTGISLHLIQLNISRLMKKDVIVVKENMIVDGRVEKIYELKSKDIEFLSNITSEKGDKKFLALMSAAKSFSNVTNDIVKNVLEDPQAVNSIKAVFIKVDSKRMVEFKKKLEALIDEFESMEELDGNDVYGFINILGPYNKK